MRLGIIGLPGAGKTTVFEALTRNLAGPGQKEENRIAAIKVPDARVDFLSAMYEPQKTIHAQVEYLLPGLQSRGQEKQSASGQWTIVRECDALIHVVRNFGGYGWAPPSPAKDLAAMDQELILADLMVVEKRLERLELDQKRGKRADPEELELLDRCRGLLEAETPLRSDPELADAHLLRGYAFLSAKPMMICFNNTEDDDALPAECPAGTDETLVVKGKLEQELAQMTETEAAEFLKAFNITATAMDRVIQNSYELLGLISFFTVGKDEVRAWTIRRGTSAADAAGVIHSDFKKGFIRAEVLAYDDLKTTGGFPEARKVGKVRLEGKTYEVKDGDIITFRFNV